MERFSLRYRNSVGSTCNKTDLAPRHSSAGCYGLLPCVLSDTLWETPWNLYTYAIISCNIEWDKFLSEIYMQFSLTPWISQIPKWARWNFKIYMEPVKITERMHWDRWQNVKLFIFAQKVINFWEEIWSGQNEIFFSWVMSYIFLFANLSETRGVNN